MCYNVVLIHENYGEGDELGIYNYEKLDFIRWTFIT